MLLQRIYAHFQVYGEVIEYISMICLGRVLFGSASGAEIGCKGGNLYFAGVRGFLEIPKVQKIGFP